jgi:hypothetical protein
MRNVFRAVLVLAVLVGVVGTQVHLAHADSDDVLLQELLDADLASDMIAAFQTGDAS